MKFSDDRKSFKGMQLSYEKLITSPDSTGECQYCLTDAQVNALISVIEHYRWTTRWFHDGDVVQADTEQFVNDIQRRLMMACCNDGIDQQLAAMREMQAFEFFKLDDGTPQSYAPDTRDYFNRDSENSAEDTLRKNQLCIACRDWVYAYVQEYLKYLSTIGAVLGAAAGIAFYTGNPVFGFIFAISAGIIESLGAITVTDSDAVKKVICCMIDGLTEQTVTQEHFRHALDGCDFAFGTKEAGLAGALNSFNQTDENYRAFLVALGNAKNGAYSDIDQCDCAHCEMTINVAPGDDVNMDVAADFIDDDGYCVWNLTSQAVSTGSHYQSLYVAFGVSSFYEAAHGGMIQVSTLLINGVPRPVSGYGEFWNISPTGASEGLPHDGQCFSQLGIQTPSASDPFTVQIRIKPCP